MRVSILEKPLEDPNQKLPPPFPQPFLLPTPETHPGKKSASTCKIRKDRLQKYPKRRSHQETECCVREGKCALTGATPPAVDHRSSSSSSRSSAPSLTPSLLLCGSAGHSTKLCAVRGCCKCKRCTPQQRLQWLFQKLTPLSRFRFHFLLHSVCSCARGYILLSISVCRCMHLWHFCFCACGCVHRCVYVTFSQNS